MNNQFNELTPAEAERLALLAEECGEVIQVIGKILRHGYASFSPFDDSETPNRQLLEKELGHVEFAQKLLIGNKDINPNGMVESYQLKSQKVWHYLHHQVKPTQ